MYRIAVAGNPNSGKTCLFNNLTGANQHVGNYPGVTVEFVTGESVFCGEKVEIIDLPGTYSMTAYSQEEIVARNFIVDERPDVIINVVDASNLERNLYLTTQLLELNVPVVIALNMIDIAEKKGHTVNPQMLSAILGVEVVKTVACRSEGIDDLKSACLKTIKEKIIPKTVTYTHEVRLVLPELEKAVEDNKELCGHFPPRWIAVKLLEDDEAIIAKLENCATSEKIKKAVADAKAKIQAHSNEDSATAIVEARYGFASGAAREVTQMSENTKRMLTDYIDRVVCNRLLGPVILCAVVYFLFVIVFQLAEGEWIPLFNGEWTSPTGVVGLIFESMTFLARKYITVPELQSMICDGVIGGVGGVMEFVPLLFFMFFFIAILEDSGYIARVAFIMDRVLRTFGLQGKSILAMIVSGGLGAGGCAVPGVMAARTLREDKDRLITILVAPFMNCGAKMPVYAMLIGAFFAKAQGAMMFLLWFLSWCFALTSAFFLRKFVIKGEQTPFVMELPVYHMPTFKGVLMDTWHRTYMFIKKAATIILAVSIVMWALMYYPRYDSKPTEKAVEKLQSSLSQKTAKSKFSPILTPKEIEATESASYEPEKIKNLKGIEKLRGEFTLAVNEFKTGKKVKNKKVIVDYLEYCKTKQELENKLSENQLLNSIAGRVGHFLVPVSQLAGFQWKENIALIGGFAAKEVVLGTLGTAYSMGDATENPEPLSEILAHHPDWNPLRAFVMLVFVMAYAPCVVTIATIKKETGKWSWALFSTAYSTTLAFIVATVIYQVGSLF